MNANTPISSIVDYTNLKPDALPRDIRRLCLEAIEHRFFSVCILPYHVPLAAALLSNTHVKVVTVAGFPLGGNTARIKVQEARQAALNGAAEIDMVVNFSAFKSGNLGYVRREIEAVKKGCGVPVKVIIEVGLLDDREITEFSLLAAESGADFIKTSTGLGPRGATARDVRIIRDAVKNRALIKAAGGIRTREQASELLSAGADRLGTSSLQVIS